MQKSDLHTDLSPRSAGRLMIEHVPIIHPLATITEVENLLLKTAKKLETINYVYVVDSDQRLMGVLSIKELFRSPKATKVADVMHHELVTVRPHTDQERVALLSIEHNLKDIPVVDSENRFLGVVPSDTIMNVLHEENVEDLLKFAGVHSFQNSVKEIATAPAGIYFKKRFPWLIVGLGGGFIAASIVSAFETTLRLQLVLASFIPAIVYLADAVGTQTQTIFIRSLSLNQKLNLRSYITRETKVGIMIAIAIGVLVYGISFFFWTPSIAIILGLSFIFTVLAAIAIALFLPWIFLKFRIDPAIASGPFATVIRDIMSLVIYLTIASLILT